MSKITPWSITTTVRNLQRVPDFAKTLNRLNNQDWNKKNQSKYQIMLIQDRAYGYNKEREKINSQFKAGLNKEDIDLIESLKDIPLEIATKIGNKKNYTGDLDMRGRQSFTACKKLGLVYSDKKKKITITSLGKELIENKIDFNLIVIPNWVFKWQLPNPLDNRWQDKNIYDIKPFIGTLHLIKKVNELCIKANEKAKGISREEWNIFVPTLLHYKKIKTQAELLLLFRKKIKIIKQNDKNSYIKNFVEKNLKLKINDFETKLRDYGDNALRNFRLTNMIRLRGGGYWIDLEERRSIEISKLLKLDSSKSLDLKDDLSYALYLSNKNLPKLPWENPTELKIIKKKLQKEVINISNQLKIKLVQLNDTNNTKDLIKQIEEIREKLRYMQDIKNKKNLNLKQIIEDFKDFKLNFAQLEERTAQFFLAIGDGKIKGNYLVDDTNQLISHAPGEQGDIECFYESFNKLIEVTKLTGAIQWKQEVKSVQEHLQDFEKKSNKKETFCLFIAPSIHKETSYYFHNANYHDFPAGEKKRKIIPINITQFLKIQIEINKYIERKKNFSHKLLFNLYSNLSNIENFNDSNEWIQNFDKIINNWIKKDLGQ